MLDLLNTSRSGQLWRKACSGTSKEEEKEEDQWNGDWECKRDASTWRIVVVVPWWYHACNIPWSSELVLMGFVLVCWIHLNFEITMGAEQEI